MKTSNDQGLVFDFIMTKYRGYNKDWTEGGTKNQLETPWNLIISVL